MNKNSNRVLILPGKRVFFTVCVQVFSNSFNYLLLLLILLRYMEELRGEMGTMELF